MNADVLYYSLLETAENAGAFVSTEADELLADAARAIAEHPDSEEN